MPRPPLLFSAFVLIGLIGWASHAAAHGDAHKKPAEAPSAPSPYALEPTPEEKPLEGDDLLSPFARSGALGSGMEEGMGHDMGGHEMGDHDMGHDMPEVEPARHTVVPSSKNGYPWAIAITAVSGLLFGALALRRG